MGWPTEPIMGNDGWDMSFSYRLSLTKQIYSMTFIELLASAVPTNFKVSYCLFDDHWVVMRLGYRSGAFKDHRMERALSYRSHFWGHLIQSSHMTLQGPS